MQTHILIKIASCLENKYKYVKADIYYKRILLKFANNAAIAKMQMLGVSQDILNFIESVENPKEKQLYISRVFTLLKTQKPEELQLEEISKPVKVKKTKMDYMEENIKYFYNKSKEIIEKEYEHEPQFKNWCIYIIPEYTSINEIDNINNAEQLEKAIIDFINMLDDLYEYLSDKRELLGPQAQIDGGYEEIIEEKHNFYDNLDNYYGGISLYYTDDDEIIYSPEKWNGWKMVKVESSDNLYTEGLKLDICLKDGTYHDKVADAEMIIFSLRDAHNYPHGIMGIGPDGIIEAPKGRKNHPLAPELREMFDEFMRTPEYDMEQERLYEDSSEARYERAIEEFEEEWHTISLIDVRDALGKKELYDFLYDIYVEHNIIGDTLQETNLKILQKYLRDSISHLIRDADEELGKKYETLSTNHSDFSFNKYRKLLIDFINKNGGYIPNEEQLPLFSEKDLRKITIEDLKEIAINIYMKEYMELDENELRELINYNKEDFIEYMFYTSDDFVENIFDTFRWDIKEKFRDELYEYYLSDNY